MTFDFAPGWMETRIHNAAFAPENASAVPSRSDTPAPTYPTPVELAVLVSELFAEGALSCDQLRSLVLVPELAPHLRDTMTLAVQKLERPRP